MPDQSTLNRWARLIQPATLHRLLDHVVHLATQRHVTQGRKLRVDGTVVETTIHHPSDSTLLNDGVRVLSRTLQRARQVVADAGALAQDAFVDQTQNARERMKQIMYVARQKGEEAADRLKTAYRDLVDLTQTVVEQARQVATVLREQTSRAAERIATNLETMLPRVEQVIGQTRRRVLQGESVSASDKIVSLFEPHTAILRKGKAGKPTEFGREVWLDEVDGGIITRSAILDGNPDEKAQLLPSIDHHTAQFGQPPALVTADRGVYSGANERAAAARGVASSGAPQARQAVGKAFGARATRLVPKGTQLASGHRRPHQWPQTQSRLRRCRYHGAGRYGALGRLGYSRPQSAQQIARHQVA